MLNPFASVDWSNPVAGVDAAIRTFVKSNLPQVNATTHPALAAAVTAGEDAAITIVEEAVKAYALPLILKEVGPVLDAIAVKFPVAAPEIAALKAKIAG